MIIIDKKTPPAAKEKLVVFGELMELETSGITYPAISGHPDIFFCQTPAGLIVAPNLPGKYFSLLDQYKIKYGKGKAAVGKTYPQTAHYNAVVTSKYLIHNLNFTDPVLLKACKGLTPIHVNQGYTRCNLLPMNDDVFLTSDQGICNALIQQGKECHFFNPHRIQLYGFEHGFLGGTCGVFKRYLFSCGSMVHHEWGDKFEEIANTHGFEIIPLINKPLQDFGSIIFVEE